MFWQYYVLGFQNWLIFLEMKVWYMEYGWNFEVLRKELIIGQLFVFCFVFDEEFLELIDCVIVEKLLFDVIKKVIKNWKGDYLRV